MFLGDPSLGMYKRTSISSGSSGTAWDVSTAVYSSKSVSVAGQDTGPSQVQFSSDGTKMYVLGAASNKIYQYSLSIAWDVSTAAYASKSYNGFLTQETAPKGIAFSSDGTKLYLSGANGVSIYQYTLSSAWDISTASYASKSVSVSGQDGTPRGVAFSSDGTKMYVAGNTNKTIYQYTLSSAWDVSTASYASKSADVSAVATPIWSIQFKDDGTKMYVADVTDTAGIVFQYSLSVAWDVSTYAYDSKSYNIASQDSALKGLAFSSDGTEFYITGDQNNTVFQYTM